MWIFDKLIYSLLSSNMAMGKVWLVNIPSQTTYKSTKVYIEYDQLRLASVTIYNHILYLYFLNFLFWVIAKNSYLYYVNRSSSGIDIKKPVDKYSIHLAGKPMQYFHPKLEW